MENSLTSPLVSRRDLEDAYTSERESRKALTQMSVNEFSDFIDLGNDFSDVAEAGNDFSDGGQ